MNVCACVYVCCILSLSLSPSLSVSLSLSLSLSLSPSLPVVELVCVVLCRCGVCVCVCVMEGGLLSAWRGVSAGTGVLWVPPAQLHWVLLAVVLVSSYFPLQKGDLKCFALGKTKTAG